MQPKLFIHGADEEEIVLPVDLKERLSAIVQVASATSARGFPMRSILIHGQPGCGKSMVAKSLAQSTGLPFVMMSGGDGKLGGLLSLSLPSSQKLCYMSILVFPLKSQGPSELRRLLLWASKGRGDNHH